MTRIDLDDLPPKVAALLTGVSEGEEVLLVQSGAVVGRLTGAAAPDGGDAPAPEVAPEVRAKEIFELFRSSIEDEF
jgi:antitoxin (DNA-binding transcriptional repressor) of toxin-antitoxin stability system